jgi:piezo-type mechanosensitive ion channel component 1/2
MLLRPYLVYIVLVSVHSCLVLWQTIKRIKKNKPARTPTVVFKSIRRSDTDKDIPNLLKYLINYGFYKFGIEICLMGYVTVVGARMDIIACCYATWMLFLYNLERELARKVWNWSHGLRNHLHPRLHTNPISIVNRTPAWPVLGLPLE